LAASGAGVSRQCRAGRAIDLRFGQDFRAFCSGLRTLQAPSMYRNSTALIRPNIRPGRGFARADRHR
jgi:hypothetical protein